MRGSALLVFACMAGFSTTAAYAEEGHVWDGVAELRASTAECDHLDVMAAFRKGEPFSRYRAKLGPGEKNSALSFVFPRAATIFQTTSSSSQMHGRGKYMGVVIHGKVDYRDTAGSYDFEIEPAAVTASTKTVTLAGTIENFWGTPGCNIEIDVKYKKHHGPL